MPGAQLFASLFRLDAAGEPQPYLARRWSFSPGRDTLPVHLAPDALFHDGTPITSMDVAFSILATRDHHGFNTMLEAVERVDTPDPLTAVIRLRHPHPALFKALAVPLTPILPAHVYGDGTPLREHPANWRPGGSGPFRFKSLEPGADIELTRFADGSTRCGCARSC
ncbi:ABC transporter substrate-binding protein [Thiohalocapsa halophila]|uniref:ABC transporter substrate-binding protein n=1 Tax=Thiohalocapsa halophila TaxID=69359 RepID=UPI0019044C68|nr:ABC transporter substrate-binding protein [Thiohalocapsa halophila]